MIQYKQINLHKSSPGICKPCRKLPECVAVLLVLGVILILILFSLTHSGLIRKVEINDVHVPKVRSFTGRKPKVYRTPDVDMDPLRVEPPYYSMKIPKNSTCKERKPVLSKRKLPRTALVSFPGSGSTWLRHITQQLTGIATGSTTCRKEFKQSKSFSVGECKKDNRVILISSHDRYRRRTFEKLFDKLIILYRDPFETLRSAYTMKHPGHSESVDSEIFNVRGWYEFVRDQTTLWEKYYSDWLEADRPVLLLYYEDLQHNLPSVLKQLGHFLERKITKRDINCAVATSEGHFHRRHVHNITNSEIFVGKLSHKLTDAELNVAETAKDRRHEGEIIESGKRLIKVIDKADEEDKEDTSL